MSVSGSMAANFDTPFGEKGIAQSTKTKEDKAGNDVLTHGAESLQTGLVVGLGSDKDRQRSQTKSGINTANLVIRDEQAQLAKTGKTAEEAKAGLNTAITTDNAAAHSGKLENRFDKAKLQKELDYQVKATQEFQTITKPGIDGVMNQIAANKQAKAALENAGDSQGAARLREEAKDWEMGGKYRQATDALTNALGLALGGKPTAGVIAGAASPYINQKIKEITQDMPKLNIPAHMIWGAIEAELQGGKAASGAISAGVGEAGATYLAQALYGTEKAESLTEAQKQHISTLSQFAAGVAGGLAGTESAHSAGNNAAIGMGVAENAVEHNFLKQVMENPQYALSLVEFEKANIIKESTEKEIAEEEVDRFVPHYITINGELYAVGVKGILNLRNGDIFLGGSFSPLVLPTRGIGASASIGWVTNLDKSDMKNIAGERVLTERISDSVISGTSASVSGCYYACLGYGQTISTNSKDKVYKTFEVGVGVGLKGNIQGASGNITEEKVIKIGE